MHKRPLRLIRNCLVAVALVLTIIAATSSPMIETITEAMTVRVVHAAEPDLMAILEAIDEQSNFSGTDFSATMTVLSQDPQKGVEKLVVRMFRRDSEDKFLLLIQEPSVQRGQGYLRDGDNLWFYDPESRIFSHTSLKESFEGSDARNADFSQSSLAQDYRVTAYEEGTLGAYEVYIIDLEARHNEVADPYLKIWVTKDTNLLLKAESYSLTKRLMRTALYPSYQKVGDSLIPRQMLFIDELVPDKRTQITMTDVSTQPLEIDVFTKAYVERVNR